MKAARAWLIAVLALFAIGGAVFAYARSNKRPETKYETVKVDRGRITARVTATGTVSALVTVQVGSQVSGRIAELHADFNSAVKKGDVLARIDAQLFEATRAQARANFTAAQANLAKAKVQAEDA